MNRTYSRNLLLLVIILLLFTVIPSTVAQNTPDQPPPLTDPSDNLALWGQLQRKLAGDPDTWQWRNVNDPDGDGKGPFVHEDIDPEGVLYLENWKRTKLNGKTFDITNGSARSNAMYDADSWAGSFYRVTLDYGTGILSAVEGSVQNHDNYFAGDYIIETDSTSEVDKIRDIYSEIVSKVNFYGPPKGGETASLCLTEGRGECRHMAAILQESLEEVGVDSQLMISPTHVWVRVTMSDAQYAGMTFDLDPTWYVTPIALPVREKNELEDIDFDLMQRVLAVDGTVSEGLVDMTGLWESTEDDTLVVSMVSDSMVFTYRKPDGNTGSTSLTGNLQSDGTFTGQKYLVAEECPHLNHYTPAWGKLSQDGTTLEIKFTNKKYDIEGCYNLPGTEFTDSVTYTRALPEPSPTDTSGENK